MVYVFFINNLVLMFPVIYGKLSGFGILYPLQKINVLMFSFNYMIFIVKILKTNMYLCQIDT